MNKLLFTLLLALGLGRTFAVAAGAPSEKPVESSNVPKRLEAMQHAPGGWVTDYDRNGRPRGLANETARLALIALTQTR